MTVANGYQLPDLILFVTSLLETGYNGDLVISLSDIKPETLAYFRYHKDRIILYDIGIRCRRFCQVDLYRDKNGSLLVDPRKKRQVAQLRFEIFWAWTQLYSSTTRVFFTDSRDVYFHRNPFENLPTMTTTLHVFEEPARVEQSLANSNWLRKTYPDLNMKDMYPRNIICSGTTLGGKPAMDMYARAMVHQFDVTQSTRLGGDQGHNNFLIHTNKLVGIPNITNITIHEKGRGLVNTVGLIAKLRGPLSEVGLLRNGTVWNSDGTISPVVHMFDRDQELKDIQHNRSLEELAKWNELLHQYSSS
eukprot:CAMPEP_0202496900 /NCGR_PEP_ID=MMETSP1361-20130828/21314_1 /ASSEMBLY_ACC=CAM_ASM_000849 /TAXON_ID=210615 /ORGANISM="Staurosira complex sp., Strain CCMP2646" /LENGTH=303 /DNA_ID=CAMNT_0049128345 /DNA_START=251 /DNA_END=1162 /DNA_ORIENTATION=+